ncbi:MAG: AIR synthase-related protein, partial [Halobacteriales archaeon]|nr:AIR synthase-related protein [Halobacteriales archaeon]
GVTIVGGHSEYAPDLEQPLLSITCLGVTDRYVSSGGAEPGDAVILTKGAGIEGTAVLATDFRDDLQGQVASDVIDEGAGFFDDVSVIPDAAILGDRATAMHDPTEGGLMDGLLEMAVASGVVLAVSRSAIPIREATATITEAMGVDPLRIFGSGALVATVPAEVADAAIADLVEAGIEAAVIGTVEPVPDSEVPGVRIDGESITEPGRDDLYQFWE